MLRKLYQEAGRSQQALQIRRHVYHHAEKRCAACIDANHGCADVPGMPLHAKLQKAEKQKHVCKLPDTKANAVNTVCDMCSTLSPEQLSKTEHDTAWHLHVHHHHMQALGYTQLRRAGGTAQQMAAGQCAGRTRPCTASPLFLALQSDALFSNISHRFAVKACVMHANGNWGSATCSKGSQAAKDRRKACASTTGFGLQPYRGQNVVGWGCGLEAGCLWGSGKHLKQLVEHWG